MNECTLVKAKNGDLDAQTDLLEENSGLIWSIVRRYIGRGTEPDDLYQLGCIGFLKALHGYDLSFGTQFSTYAVPKIAGEIRRFLRDDGSVKVSRTLKEQASAIKRERERLITAFGRDPTVGELSSAVGLSAEEIAAAETATSAAASLQSQFGEDGFSLESVLSSADDEETLLERISLREALMTLSEKERQVVSLRYFHGLTQSKAAEVVHVSQVQVSRIERKAIFKLQQYFHLSPVEKCEKVL